MARQQARARGRPRKRPRKDGEEYLYGAGVAVMVRTRLERATIRWQKALLRAKGYQFPQHLKVIDHMEEALVEMQKTVQALSRVPAGWKPAVGAVGGPLLEEGSMVQIREKYREQYYFIATIGPLRIAAINGTRILCDLPTKNGMAAQFLFPKAHIRLVHG